MVLVALMTRYFQEPPLAKTKRKVMQEAKTPPKTACATTVTGAGKDKSSRFLNDRQLSVAIKED